MSFPACLAVSPVALVFAEHALAQLGAIAAKLGATSALLVTDPAIRAAGHVDVALRSLAAEQFQTYVFDDVVENPTTDTVAAGLDALHNGRPGGPDLIIGLGGGSVMDCAKGINLLHRCGGNAADYRGDPSPEILARRPALLPMILIPTTAGTGSEAQSFALISDAATHMKMPCGDRRPPRQGGLRPHVALLDPALTRTVPPGVAAVTGMDALTHAVETAGCRVRTDESRALSREAWLRLEANFETALQNPSDTHARGAMLLGAHLAGAAIEQSMLGAAHACANPLTARFGITHGAAVGLMMPHVVRFNCARGENPYYDLSREPEALVRRLTGLLTAAALPTTLSAYGVAADDLPLLASQAAQQWTAGFNPRALDAAAMLDIYCAAI